MSGDWIKMRGNLWDDPRIGRICDMTGASEAAAIGALYWLWATADQHTEDGCMPGLSMHQIDRKTGVKGFAAALVDVGWLTDDPQGVVIRNFSDHNGASAKKRAQTARRVAAHRSSSNDDETPNSASSNATSVTPALAREEKRREIPSEAIASAAGAAPAKADLTKAELWSAGKSLLRQQGMPEAQCGTFVGALVKAHGEEQVVAAVRRAVLEQPADAASWLKGAMRARPAASGKHAGFEAKDYRSGVTADGFIA